MTGVLGPGDCGGFGVGGVLSWGLNKEDYIVSSTARVICIAILRGYTGGSGKNG